MDDNKSDDSRAEYQFNPPVSERSVALAIDSVICKDEHAAGFEASEEIRQAKERYAEFRRDIAETYDRIDAMCVEFLERFFPYSQGRNA